MSTSAYSGSSHESSSSEKESNHNGGVARQSELESEKECENLECLDESNSQLKSPEINMEFKSEENAFDFYQNYALKKGFTIRKDWKNKNKLGVVTSRRFFCSKQGYWKPDKRDKGVKKPRKDTKCGCRAFMTINLKENGKYVIAHLEKNHNHDLVIPKKSTLKSQKKLTKAQATTTDLSDDSGDAPKTTVEFMSRQAGDQTNNGFLSLGYKNCLLTKRERALNLRDAAAVMHYFQKKQKEHPSFYYAMQLDVSQKITNMFWADAKMIVDYEYFGDVVCFDTTYRMNREDHPLSLFVGVNHHKQSIIFGGALLYDETTESFEWLFQTFVEAMSGKRPKTILTDQSVAMANAIKSVLPNTCHRICVWHIFQNAMRKISFAFRRGSTFSRDFSKCIFDCEDEEEFVQAWNNMLEAHDLKENNWLQKQFSSKEKWALAYGRNTFCADMKSTQQSESINSVLRKDLNNNMDLLQFLKHLERVVDDCRNAELNANFKDSQGPPKLMAKVMMLTEAASIYTHAVFKKFQEEYAKLLACDCICCSEFGTVFTYKITMEDEQREHLITFDSSNETLDCSCRKFQFTGILCCHAIKVLNFRNIKMIPRHYILERWTKFAKVGIVNGLQRSAIEVDPNFEVSSRYQILCPIVVKMVARAAESDAAFKYILGHCDDWLNRVNDLIVNDPPNKYPTEKGHGSTVQTEGEKISIDGTDYYVNIDEGSQSVQVQGIARNEECLRGNNKRTKIWNEKLPARRKTSSHVPSQNTSSNVDNNLLSNCSVIDSSQNQFEQRHLASFNINENLQAYHPVTVPSQTHVEQDSTPQLYVWESIFSNNSQPCQESSVVGVPQNISGESSDG
ncbi:PREDICTED: protein FAR1-RELATED SEQUENCE 5-like isoform X2 [Nelumbo nucifera]|uniref:Protein FAR1-RELATED SEQUENCE n=1 Tax=Nelumbo nucifera TaxID=4432 RepID=A0A1U8AR70_NELNU|nr:PREDICTED: protein FAR1-RELATED SEQUENCE 5-like isoform X2 [Nelumbo nucifera]XP_010265221.1 PREDICTED: protein FAR1-RELATED SEQUENCE 5-like isoform X2 [Nelumbo nucifera]